MLEDILFHEVKTRHLLHDLDCIVERVFVRSADVDFGVADKRDLNTARPVLFQFLLELLSQPPQLVMHRRSFETCTRIQFSHF